MKSQAIKYLRKALKDPNAIFRDGQWESIESLLNKRRVLVIQRTGFGKSLIYFIATKLMREEGGDPTLIISPLLALMRNQLDMASRIIRAEKIDDKNKDEWPKIQRRWISDQVDALLISPERLANDEFISKFLDQRDIGMFVIDEAHCISDWGHDFRPDYRRIKRIIQAMPSNVPVLATTATANDRVVEDVKSQLGENIETIRGSLVRKSLKLQNIYMPNRADRMAWLAETLPTLIGCGIIYTLTRRDAENLTSWLQLKGINAKTYHAGIENSMREKLEQQLLNNKIKTLVATTALSMGFDKPDLGFVIHFQRPASVVHYYQQVGRAGRAVDAFGILLCGEEDDCITDHFIREAFPSQQFVSDVLELLEKSDDALSLFEIQDRLNLSKSQIEKTLKFLSLESPSPVIKTRFGSSSKWQVTATASSYTINENLISSITEIRKKEQSDMRKYMEYSGCLMAYLQKKLDDPAPQKCNQCRNCMPDLLLDEGYDENLAIEARKFIRTVYQILTPKKRWPRKDMFENYHFEGGRIGQDLMAGKGRALCLWRDGEWGNLVADGKYKANNFDAKLVKACAEMIRQWQLDPSPVWVCCIPSLKRPKLVQNFAEKLADDLGLPFIQCIQQRNGKQEQKLMENSYHQAKNLDGIFTVSSRCGSGVCLLVDDIVCSGWTLTIAAALLRQKGCSAVHPVALALNSPRMN